MTKNIDLSKENLFPVGELFKSDNFSGQVWLQMLTADPSCPVANVTFAPACCNNWHWHHGGQLLLVTGGRGYYQEWGQPARELHPGDVVEIPAQVKHWHGAAPDSWFSHLAIELHPELGPAQWLEPVAEADYRQLK